MRVQSIRKIAARIMGVGKSKIWIDPEKRGQVTEAITTADIRALIKEGAIKKRRDNHQSHAHARVLQRKKRLGRKRGAGKRSGTKKARVKPKRDWMNHVRALRKKLVSLRREGMVKDGEYRRYYRLTKARFFKGKKHLEQTVKGEKG